MKKISWRTGGILNLNERGGAIANVDNVYRVLQKTPEYGPDRLWYDEFLHKVLVSNSPTRQWVEEDYIDLLRYVQNEKGPGISHSTLPMVKQAVQSVTRERTRHCVREWLKSLKWDGTERITHAFEDHWGAVIDARHPSDHVRSASRNFFVGLIARVFEPGCKVDNVVVFEGPQEQGKSLALSKLAGDWFATMNIDARQKDFVEALRGGKWIFEIAENDAFGRAEASRVKAIITTQSDFYRRSYGHEAEDFPRQNIFVVTANEYDWGNDPSGLRRFWPIRCDNVNPHSIALIREQLFAEALHEYLINPIWWKMPPSTKEVQSDRQYKDAWTEDIAIFVQDKPEVSYNDIQNALGIQKGDKNNASQRRIASVMKSLKWIKHENVRRNGAKIDVFMPPEDDGVF